MFGAKSLNFMAAKLKDITDINIVLGLSNIDNVIRIIIYTKKKLTSCLNCACRGHIGFLTLRAGLDENKTTSRLSIGIWRIMT